MTKEFSYKEEYDEKTDSLHVVNSAGCDWEGGVGVNPYGYFCGECDMICKEECPARTIPLSEFWREIYKTCRFYKNMCNVDNFPYADMCFAYHDGIEREDGLEWGHFPKCCPEKCPRLHPEILKENKAHWA